MSNNEEAAPAKGEKSDSKKRNFKLKDSEIERRRKILVNLGLDKRLELHKKTRTKQPPRSFDDDATAIAAYFDKNPEATCIPKEHELYKLWVSFQQGLAKGGVLA